MKNDIKTVFITGGASGLGFLLGQCYAKEGKNVVLVDINRDALEKCVREIQEYHENVIGVVTDVRSYEQVCEARDRAVERFGSIDILINCAGGAELRITGTTGEFFEVPIDVYDFGIDLNLKGVLYCDHAIMKQMAKQNSGVIVHLGSVAGTEGSPTNIAYSASKSALMEGMTRSVAAAGEKYNIRAVCIAPGPVLTRPAMAKMKTPLGRAAEPQEIVDMIMYAASEKCTFLNGVSILMDGGRNVMRYKV